MKNADFAGNAGSRVKNTGKSAGRSRAEYEDYLEADQAVCADTSAVRDRIDSNKSYLIYRSYL